MFCHHLQQKQVVQKRHKSEIMTKKTHRGKDKGKKEKESDGFQQYTFQVLCTPKKLWHRLDASAQQKAFTPKLLHGQNWSILKKIWTKLNKNNKYRDQIEYKTLTLTRGMLLDDTWTFKKMKTKFKKIQKIKQKKNIK